MTSTYNSKKTFISRETNKENKFNVSNDGLDNVNPVIRKFRKTNDLSQKPTIVQEQEVLRPFQKSQNLSINYKDIIMNKPSYLSKSRAGETKETERNRVFLQKDRSYLNRGREVTLKEKEKSIFGDLIGKLVTKNKLPILKPDEASSLKVIEKPKPKSKTPILDDETLFGVIDKGEAVKTNFQAQCDLIIQEYSEDILESLQERIDYSGGKHWLKRHSISTMLRAKMINWMVEVLCSYKCKDQTFFLAALLMDLYLEKTPKVLELSDLHLVGIACMFIASKYEEIHPIKLVTFYEKISHKRLSTLQIKDKEMQILEALQYKLTNPTIYEMISTILFQLDLKNRIPEKEQQYLEKVCVYLAKSTIFDYEGLNTYDFSEISNSVIFVAFKITEKVYPNFATKQLIEALKSITNPDQSRMLSCSKNILSLIKNFDTLYPSLSNIKKFHPLEFEENSAMKTTQL